MKREKNKIQKTVFKCKISQKFAATLFFDNDDQLWKLESQHSSIETMFFNNAELLVLKRLLKDWEPINE